MSARVCLITGTTHGIGTVVAREIARAGFTVVMICRDERRAALVADHIQRSTGAQRPGTIVCDLSVLASVNAAADAFLAGYDRLDLLVNNAGTMTTRPRRSADGVELMFATNHLGPFLLTRRLLDVLKDSAPARIVNVASQAHYRAAMDLDDVETLERFRGMRAYSRSKLANVMFTLSLAERLEGTGVTANCVHPGLVASNIFPTDNGALRLLAPLARPFMLSVERGATSALHAALSPEMEGVTGKYLDEHAREQSPSLLARDADARQRLWEHSSEFLDRHELMPLN